MSVDSVLHALREASNFAGTVRSGWSTGKIVLACEPVGEAFDHGASNVVPSAAVCRSSGQNVMTEPHERGPMKRLCLFALPVALFLFAGCDGEGGNDDQNPDIGEFSVTVTGSYDLNFGSHATAFLSSSGNRFLISLGSGTMEALSLRSGSTELPDVGQYFIVEDDPDSSQFEGGVWVNPNASFEAVAGSVTITSSSDTEIEGSLAITADGRADAVGQTIGVNGTFRAKVEK